MTDKQPESFDLRLRGKLVEMLMEARNKTNYFHIARKYAKDIKLIFLHPVVYLHHCTTCNHHFTSVRKEAKYCSDKCKSKAYRDRKK